MCPTQVTGRDARAPQGTSELYKVACRSRGSGPSLPRASLRSATSSAWSWSSCSRENPVASTSPSSPTTTAPTENAESDGGHSRDSSTAQRRNR